MTREEFMEPGFVPTLEDYVEVSRTMNPMIAGRDWYDSFVDERMNLGTGGLPMLVYCGLGLGEAGECAGKIKKIYRDDNGVVSAEKRVALVHELGDLLFYLTRTAHELGMSLEGVKIENLKKLSDRDQRGTRRGSGDER